MVRVLVNFRSLTLIQHLPSLKYFVSPKVRIAVSDEDHKLTLPVVKDNDDLAIRGSTLLVRMCGVTPPVPLVNPMLDAIFDAIQTSPVRNRTNLYYLVSDNAF